MDGQRYIVVIGIIAICAMIFTAEQSRHESFADDWGSSPTKLRTAVQHLKTRQVSRVDVQAFANTITHIFLHGDVDHILYNMVFLWAFGVLVCDLVGQRRMLIIFIACGIGGAIVQAILDRDSGPAIGASGAIAGLQGFYLGLALRWHLPNVRVWPVAYPIPPMQMAALGVLGFIGDIVMFGAGDRLIAHGAHLGGLLTGLAIAALITTLYPTPQSLNPSVNRRAG